MARIVEYLGEEEISLGLVEEEDKKKLLVSDERGRKTRLSPDHVLFRHSASSIAELTSRLERLTSEVDVELLWESVAAEAGPALEAADLARLFFSDGADAHASAVFRALVAERLHFRRRGRAFEPRSAEEVATLRAQRESERRAQEESGELEAALRGRRVDDELAGRLERSLRGAGADRALARVLELLYPDPARGAFDLLVETGHLPGTADFEVVRADLRRDHPAAVLEHAASIVPLPEAGAPLRSAFSIDDEDTTEVDDALAVSAEGDGVRIDIDIADPSAYVAPGDPIDVEALRRSTTVYLPTGVVFMMPPRLGCGVASLAAGEERRAIRTTVHLDASAEVSRFEVGRVAIRVERRLSYDEADALLASGSGETAEALRLLDAVSARLAEKRHARGAVSLHRAEWKIRVADDGASVSAKRIDPGSPSRRLVAEMAILTNALAARLAAERGIPIIFRGQAAPVEPLPPADPASPEAFERVRRLLKPAVLSLSPAPHFALGLSAYTQVTSPLRRYADLVVQRQLVAALAGAPVPYDHAALLAILAAAESSEHEAKRIEAAVTERWALEHVARLGTKERLEATVLGVHPGGGHRVQLESCGAIGVLVDEKPRPAGASVLVDVRRVEPRRGLLRLLPST
jgi:exoribonuclease II